MFKLYHEVPTEKAGQRSAAPNVGLQVGLQESTTGIAKGRVIIASLDVPLLRAVSEWGQSGDDSHLGRTIVRIPKTPAQVGMD